MPPSGDDVEREIEHSRGWQRVRQSSFFMLMRKGRDEILHRRAEPDAHGFGHAHVTLIHALVGTSWILGSDRVLALATAEVAQLQVLQTYKGLLYVAATTFMLYLLLERVTRSLSRGRRSLIEKQRELETLLANLPGGVYRRGIGMEESYSLLSPGAATLLGGPRDAAGSERAFSAIVHEADQRVAQQRIEEALRTRTPFEVSYRVATAEGVRWIWDHGRGVEAPDGSLHIEGYVCDVTEHRRLQERLQHTQRMESVGCMASSIAHDFNNVLFAVESGCELLSSQPLTDTEQELVAVMRGASDTGRGLVARLLAFARNQGCQTSELDLNAVVRRVQPLMQRLLPRKVELQLELHLSQATVQADATQLEQVILNLVTNAGQAIDGRGKITVSTTLAELSGADAQPLHLSPGTYLELSVEDTGSGIDPAVLPRIFEPFFTTKGEAGTGLGLATVQKIVRDMGGAVSVTSQLGSGTRFSVLLPVAQLAPRSLTVPPPAPHGARSLRPSGAAPIGARAGGA